MKMARSTHRSIRRLPPETYRDLCHGGRVWGTPAAVDNQITGANPSTFPSSVYVRLESDGSCDIPYFSAQVLYYGGAPQSVPGLVQINAQLPPDVLVGDAVPLYVGLYPDSAVETDCHHRDSVNHMTKITLLTLLAPVSMLAQQYTISTFAGGGPLPTSVPASSVQIPASFGVAVSAAGDVYFGSGNAVMKVDSQGILTRIAGTGQYGLSADGGSALSAQLAWPAGLVIDSAGNLYIAENAAHRVRKVSPQGIISTVVGETGPTAIPATEGKLPARSLVGRSVWRSILAETSSSPTLGIKSSARYRLTELFRPSRPALPPRKVLQWTHPAMSTLRTTRPTPTVATTYPTSGAC